jgi:hypothetical protein
MQPLAPPVKFDALWCTEDNRVRVATIGVKHYVSIDGDNFCGPHKTLDAAREYGASIARAKAEGGSHG